MHIGPKGQKAYRRQLIQAVHKLAYLNAHRSLTSGSSLINCFSRQTSPENAAIKQATRLELHVYWRTVVSH